MLFCDGWANGNLGDDGVHVAKVRRTRSGSHRVRYRHRRGDQQSAGQQGRKQPVAGHRVGAGADSNAVTTGAHQLDMSGSVPRSPTESAAPIGHGAHVARS